MDEFNKWIKEFLGQIPNEYSQIFTVQELRYAFNAGRESVKSNQCIHSYVWVYDSNNIKKTLCTKCNRSLE